MTQPTPADAALGFAAFGDLLRHADLAPLQGLPRNVLETALGLRRASGEPPTTSEIGHALLRLLDARTPDQAPLVLVIDDLQCVDAATRELLTFIARRLPRAGVCVLASQRGSDRRWRCWTGHRTSTSGCERCSPRAGGPA